MIPVYSSQLIVFLLITRGLRVNMLSFNTWKFLDVGMHGSSLTDFLVGHQPLQLKNITHIGKLSFRNEHRLRTMELWKIPRCSPGRTVLSCFTIITKLPLKSSTNKRQAHSAISCAGKVCAARQWFISSSVV